MSMRLFCDGLLVPRSHWFSCSLVPATSQASDPNAHGDSSSSEKPLILNFAVKNTFFICNVPARMLRASPIDCASPAYRLGPVCSISTHQPTDQSRFEITQFPLLVRHRQGARHFCPSTNPRDHHTPRSVPLFVAWQTTVNLSSTISTNIIPATMPPNAPAVGSVKLFEFSIRRSAIAPFFTVSLVHTDDAEPVPVETQASAVWRRRVLPQLPWRPRPHPASLPCTPYRHGLRLCVPH
ncbi:hypothetical protein F5Y16DRAFT_117787 [Xylariaceae sp. FL0255]|nr:hypothetical protein F5Y16DRAFT_117787 [Xylariaceae sp. FL0255]